MSKRHEIAVTLVSSGTIVPYLHYKPVARNWWFIPSTEIVKGSIETQMMYPIRVGMKTQ
ncbi:536_t:CDS:1, partial [Funneliformis geosporum]